MIISTSNVAPVAAISVSPSSASQDISVIADGDYSSIYTASLSTTVITFTFPTPQDIRYVALGGSNVSQKESVLIETEAGFFGYDGDLSKEEATSLVFANYSGNHSSTTTVTVTVIGSGQLKIAEIAMGVFLDIEQGVQSGYNRAWTVPNRKVRSSTNLVNAPVNATYESRSLSVTLKVSKYIMDNYEDQWYEMLRFASANTFYVREDLNPAHSYAGFNAMPVEVKADSQTTKLGAAAIQFNAYSKGVL